MLDHHLPVQGLGLRYRTETFELPDCRLTGMHGPVDHSKNGSDNLQDAIEQVYCLNVMVGDWSHNSLDQEILQA